jgi:hypothetical protein
VQLAAHVVDSPAVLVLLVNVLLVGQHQLEQPGVEFLVLQQDVAVLNVPLGQHVEIQQRSLSEQVVGLAD